MSQTRASSASRNGEKPPQVIQKPSSTPDRLGPKRPVSTDDSAALGTSPKRPRQRYFRDSPPIDDGSKPVDPIGFWAREGTWPGDSFEPKMEPLQIRRKRTESGTSTPTTPSDQRPREEKSAAYADQRYETILEARGSFLAPSDHGIIAEDKASLSAIVEAEQMIPENTLFRDDVFESTLENLRPRNEARVIQDISRLIVPSAESLASFGTKNLKILTESVNEGWNNSIPFTATRPQPDYAVGFAWKAFSREQFTKLSPYIGDIMTDESMLLGTYYMLFPFLTCEVKCGDGGLETADRQNAHSMTLSVRAVAELFRAVKREDEIHRRILAFSVSHDNCYVRIYGHYPEIDGEYTAYYRHPIHEFSLTASHGKERWTAHRFVLNVYNTWVPMHFKRICSAIDQLPASDTSTQAG